MKITSDFPGGNIIVKGIKEEAGFTEIFLEQDIRDTAEWWFYWNFRIDNPPDGKVRFSFCNNKVVCPYGAAVSKDGISWEYDPVGYEDGTHFSFVFDKNSESRYFAFTIPYQISHFENFYTEVSKDTAVTRQVLTLSEKGRDIPLIKFGNGREDVVFTARHHCCESTASYALEGVITAILKSHRGLLDKFTFHIVPFMDIDGAENGDQGKGRKPHDHNRDYTDKPIYNSVKALCNYAKKLNVKYFIDFHSPWRWGGADSRPHIHLTSTAEENDLTEIRFVNALKAITNQPSFSGIKYDGYITHIGDSSNMPGAQTADNFFKKRCEADFSVTIETPYSGDIEKVYSADLLREWGMNIAKAFSQAFTE